VCILIGPQNQGQRFVLKTTVTISPGLASKSVATVSLDLTSKPVVGGFSRFGLKIGDDGFSGLTSKLVVDGFSQFNLKTGSGGFSSLGLKTDSSDLWFEHQSHRDGFLVWASKPSGLRFIGCAIKSMGVWRRHEAHVEI
jgi:hypothetical protein